MPSISFISLELGLYDYLISESKKFFIKKIYRVCCNQKKKKKTAFVTADAGRQKKIIQKTINNGLLLELLFLLTNQ
jgi:hypothetical protein